MDEPVSAKQGEPYPGPAAAADPEAVLAALDPEQRQVALATTGPVCVLAGAGTGKTRAVAHRIAYAALTGVVDPAHVLAVTFTTRAAGELRARLVQLAGTGGGLERVQARTFHSAALRQLVHFWPATVGGRRPPAVLASKVSLLAEAARGLRVSAGAAELRDVASEIEWAKASQVRPDDYPRGVGESGPHPAAGRRAWWPGSTAATRICAAIVTWWTSNRCWSSPRPSSPSTGRPPPRSGTGTAIS